MGKAVKCPCSDGERHGGAQAAPRGRAYSEEVFFDVRLGELLCTRFQDSGTTAILK